MTSTKKIGIITWHYYSNFGSALQAFALQHTIEKLGYNVSLINYHNPKFGGGVKLKRIARILFGETFGKLPISSLYKFPYGTACFSHKYHHQSELTLDEEQLPKLTKDYETIVCGSDQIWAPNVFDPIYFASFANEKIRKVSYAASIGLNTIPANLVAQYKELLSSFYAIGIREEEGKQLLMRECGIDSTVVLDPTLMVESGVYEKMQRRVFGVDKPYLFCYFLNKEHQYKESVRKYAKEHNLEIWGVSDKVADEEWMNRLTGLGADHFLWLVNHAETVMTDSYHGSIFSLLFHKNLWIYQRFAENDPICQNSRIRQLQNNFGLTHRIISASSPIDETQTIDYDYFETQLEKLRATSLDFLKNALK